MARTFTRAVIGDWGGGDFADVMAGLDEALRRYRFIDPERLGVMGGSYGGFLTSWTVGHTTRFRAACSERAVNNTYTLFGTSDIGHSFSEAQSGYLPWENMQWYIEHSPLTYARISSRRCSSCTPRATCVVRWSKRSSYSWR